MSAGERGYVRRTWVGVAGVVRRQGEGAKPAWPRI